MALSGKVETSAWTADSGSTWKVVLNWTATQSIANNTSVNKPPSINSGTKTIAITIAVIILCFILYLVLQIDDFFFDIQKSLHIILFYENLANMFL